jgi:acyl carrier protein
MIEGTADQVEAVSDQIATYIVSGLRLEGTKRELLGADPVELPAALDSSHLLELAGHLEDAFGVVIDDEEIVLDNFATVRHLAALVVNKQAAAG